ncbi:MAG: ABC transporter substrate-binding protein, partial [Chloroflexota bacterium]|nr:ABC transporter substrate-binding protein [Chloroflexota bacterium]
TAPTAAPTAAAQAAPGQQRQVPRNRTLILMWNGQAGKYIDQELWNPYIPLANHQNGPGLFYEPLAFYSAFADKTIPWLAESWQYTPDFKSLTIKTRSGISWSDGRPFSAKDVAFTITGAMKQGAKIKFGENVQQFVAEATAPDDNTVRVTFKVPSPKFMYFMTYRYDLGLFPVPQHIFEQAGDDWAKFNHYDLAKDWPVTTGPWKLVFSSPDQKIIDRRDDWWAVKAGLVKAMPAVERIVYIPFAGETQAAQAHISNQIDSSLDLRPNTIRQVVAQNPKIVTHTGRDNPLGYVDWWPTSLYVNNEKPPFNDKDIRWALSKFLERQQIIDVAYGGAGTVASLPLPAYPALQPFVDSVKDLLQQNDTLEFNPQKGADLLTAKGYTKDAQGMWVDAGGNRLKLDIGGFEVMADIGPVVAEQLKKQGVDAQYVQPPDMITRFQQGDYVGMLFGHGGSVSGDPYFTLSLYQSQSVAVPGGHAVNFSKWKNSDYDKIVDEMAVTPAEDQAKLIDQFKRAMAIWIPELPDIPMQQWYHRIPYNQTYWTGWPTKDNPYVNGAFWHLTFQLILNNLQPAQA